MTLSYRKDQFQVNEAVAWKCPVESPEMELTGEILIFQSSPSDPIRVQGNTFKALIELSLH